MRSMFIYLLIIVAVMAIFFTVFSDPFNGRYLRPVHRYSKSDARCVHLSVYQYCAGTANSDAAALFRTSKTDIVPYAVHQQTPGWDVQLMFSTIYSPTNSLVHGVAVLI